MKSEIERLISSGKKAFADSVSQSGNDQPNIKTRIFTYTPRKSNALIISVAVLYAIILQSVISHDSGSSDTRLASTSESVISQSIAGEIAAQHQPQTDSLDETGFGGPLNDYEQTLQVDNEIDLESPQDVAVLEPVAREEKLVPTGGAEPIFSLSSDLESLSNSPVVLTKSVVNPGDTLTKIFRRNNLNNSQAIALSKTPGAKAAKVLHPNDLIKFVWNDNKLLGIEFRRKNKIKFMATFDGSGFNVIDLKKANEAGSLAKLLQREIETASSDDLTDYESQYAKLKDSNLTWSNVTIAKGDSLSSIFRRVGLDSKKAIEVANYPGNEWLASKLQPGQQINIAKSADDAFEILEVPDYKTAKVRLVFRTTDSGYFVGYKKLKTEQQEHYACAKVKTNLYAAGNQVGIPRTVINQYVSLFDSRVDFSRQLRRGDRVCIIYDQSYVHGKPLADVQIKAASLSQKHLKVNAFRHVDDDGQVTYFDGDGLSMQGHFLRSPIKYARVTSIYSNSRYHPVLKKNRPHLGVDYGAKTGTPIRATATGRVVKRAHYKGYGKLIAIQHGSRYRTLYAHMSRFAEGTGIGNYVTQGQVIGYVGSTGLSTGPHLHYEFHVDGKHRDPLTYNMPKGMPIADEYQHKFQAFVDEFSQRLAAIKAPQVTYLEPAAQTASN